MGASQERADFFNATLLVVTRHPGGPTGRPKIHPVLPRFALFFTRRLFGKNLHDTGVLASQFYAGFPTRQSLNLLANVDAQAVFMTSLPLEQRKAYKPSSNLQRLVRVASARSPKCAAPAPRRQCLRSKEKLRSRIALQTSSVHNRSTG